jgi:predicted TIM-barrel fold metal-dependent hydrolase
MSDSKPAVQPPLLDGMNGDSTDKFVAMVNAAVDVELALGKFHPRSSLKTAVHNVEKPRFPVMDYHNHLDSQKPDELLKVMDACDVEFLVNITMQVGQRALDGMDRLHHAAPDRFSTIGWMDWSDVERDNFTDLSCERLERMVEHGACGIKFWKDLGLSVRDASGEILRIDEERLAPIFEKAAELNLPVMFHTADPDAFFDPIDPYNERYEELAAHPEWGYRHVVYSKRELLEQRNRVFARHPDTTFIGAHLAESGEDLQYLSTLLDTYSNLHIDISARTPELGRQPYSARAFFLKYADRIVFGTDLLPEISMYRLYYRFLETADEYFEYPSHASRQGRWNIYGLYLPDAVLKKVYRENAQRLLSNVLRR